MDFGKYKFIKTNGYLLADCLIVTTIFLFIFWCFNQEKNNLRLCFASLGLTVFVGLFHAVFGYTKIENESDSELDVLLESDDMGTTTTKKKPVYNVDGICVKKTGKVYKIAEGMHAKVNKDYTISQKSFILSPIAKITKHTKEMKFEDLENDYDRTRWGKIFPKE